MVERGDEPTPVGPRRGYPRVMTTIMFIAVAIIILIAVVQWIRVF